MGVSRVKVVGLMLVLSSAAFSPTIRAQGTTCGGCGYSACPAGGCFACNADRVLTQYSSNGQTCTVYQKCSANCPGSPSTGCPSWSNQWTVCN